MDSVRGLLLLPLPPQNTTYSHIRTALYPSIQSTVKHIQNLRPPNETCILEIVVPITHISEAAETHLDLFKRINPLVSNIYHLTSIICKELSITHNVLDARVLLVQDDWNPDEGTTCLFGGIDYAALAVSDRPWTHLFTVESEQGEEAFRKFRTVVREHGPRRERLFAGMRRVASGMQIYVPTSCAFIANPADLDMHSESETILEPMGSEVVLTPRHIAVVISGDIKDRFHDKYLLTMALLAIGLFEMERGAKIKMELNTDMAERSAHMSVIVNKGGLNEDLKARIWNFVAGALSGTPAKQTDDNHEVQLEFHTYEEKQYGTGKTGALVVSNDHARFAREWVTRGDAAIILRSVEPVGDDVDN
ncbi:hypothetical protein F5Y09DRAFT_149699 [Xylaria sp. FL1042]|nr:hypothetical protein F5Y09DRAFT_149699 [Xylaria sp. FL1042]